MNGNSSAGFVNRGISLRLLIEILRIQQFSFVLENSQKVLQEVEEALQVLHPNENTLQTMSEVR